MTSPAPPPPVQLVEHTFVAQMVGAAIYAAAKLGIADQLRDGPRKAEDVARALGTDPDATYRLCRALTVPGVLHEEAGRSFRLTPVGELLRSDVPHSMRGMVLFVNDPQLRLRPWEDLAYSVQTGRPAFEKTHGAPLFDWLPRNPASSAVFNDAMTGLSAAEGLEVATSYDFSGVRVLCDVAGGHGSMLASILARNPGMRGVLTDLPHVLQGAPAALAKTGVQDRVQVVPGDMFQQVPAGADAYILKHIIHDWDDARCLTLLRNIRKVLPRDGRVLIADTVVPGPGQPHYGKFLDLEMLVLTSGGRERTEAEFAKLLDQAGFKLTRVVPTREWMSIVEARPA